MLQFHAVSVSRNEKSVRNELCFSFMAVSASRNEKGVRNEFIVSG